MSNESLLKKGGEKLSLDTFQQLRDLIYEKCGIFYAENKKYLVENRLTRRLEEFGFKTFEEYLYFLKYDSRRNHELSFLFDEINKNEKSLFRNLNQLEEFEKGVLTLVIEN